MKSMLSRRRRLFKKRNIIEYSERWQEINNIVLRPKHVRTETVSDNEVCPFCNEKKFSDYSKKLRPDTAFRLHKRHCEKKHECKPT